ncbi:MAG: radical SAM protein [Thermodesulfobacteriota bacterium]
MKTLARLLEQFSDTPRNIVLHADVLRRGVRPTDDLCAAGQSSCITGLATKLQGLAGMTRATPPSQFHFVADETTVDIKIDAASPYEINQGEDGAHHLFCGGERLAEVRFTPRPSYTDRQTSNGEPCAALLMQRGPFCLLVSPLNFCAYYKKGQACAYCILSSAMDLGVEAGLAPAVPDPGTIAEAVSLASADVPLKDLKICGGALYDTKTEARHYKKCLEAILSRVDAPEEISIFSQAFDEEDQKDLKSLGATNALFNLEVWDEDLWPRLLPGKAKAVGRGEWIQRLTRAVDIFGRGHVGSGFVGGFECGPGLKSRDEALRSYLAGFAFLIERGIVPWFTVWTDPASPDAPPPTEFFLRLGQGLHELLEKHGMYPDLGFPRMGVNPPTLGLYCYYCFSMSFTRDYPRLIGRKKAGGAALQ